MILCIDFGNTHVKAGIFQGNRLIHLAKGKNISMKSWQQLLKKFPVEKAILSSVIKNSNRVEAFLRKKISVHRLSHLSKLPFNNYYRTPETLGTDRIANLAGALQRFPNKNILVISAGTCITYDVVNENKNYYGGSITPGMDMRLRAMHHFTGRLPLVKKKKLNLISGRSTAESMLSGANRGALNEMNGFIRDYKSRYPGIKVLLTGGDAPYFDSRLKYRIFAQPNLVLHGLNHILSFQKNA